MTTLIIVVPLFALASALVVHHVLTWKRLRRREDLSGDDRRYFRRQLLRRIQASGLMAVLSVGLFAGLHLVSPRQSPRFFVLFWCGMVVLGVWMGLLALADLGSISRYGRRKRRELSSQRLELEDELAQRKDYQGNGHAKRVRRTKS